MNLTLRPALSSFLESLRSKPAAVKKDPAVARLQAPVHKVQRRAAGFADGFDGSPMRAPRLATQTATPAPRQGATNATNLHRDGFDVAARKPVELAPKLAPAMAAAAKARINVMRF